MKYTIFCFIFFIGLQLSAQVLPERPLPPKRDSIRKDSSSSFDKSLFRRKKEVKQDPVTIKDYKIISFARDTTIVDTSLTIQKDYKYNYLREDDFELLPFSNVGQPYNALGRNFDNRTIYPHLGAIAKHQKYYEVEDIDYYNVATPLTELTFKTTLEQGQFLDAMLTLNTSKRFNVSIAFNGSRSLGKYQFFQSEASIFRTTLNYRTKNNRYWIRGHYASQDLETEENGGITDREQFESGDDEFLERSNIDVAFTSANNNLADNRILGKRYFIDHQYNLVRPRRDSTKLKPTMLSIGHQFSYETKFYQFNQTSPSAIFGDAFDTPISDRARLRTSYNQVSANFSNKILGSLSGNINLYNFDYSFTSLLILANGETIPNRLDGDEVALGGDYSNRIGPLTLSGRFRYNLSGELSGNLLDANARYQLSEDNIITAAIHGSSRAPNFNFLLYQSDYENFNYQNDFERQQVQSITLGFNSKLYGHFSAKYSTIDNYTYFGIDENPESQTITEQNILDGNQNAFVEAMQENQSVNHLKVKYQKEFKWRKWALNNTLMYQEVNQSEQVLNVPKFVTRNSLYYSGDVFNKALFLQTGVTFKYFTSYNLDAYHPLLGEFYTQNFEEFGDFPLIDFFINARIKQTRIFLKAEHLNSIWTNQPDYYAAPTYPYRDFQIRFGLVWNFFS